MNGIVIKKSIVIAEESASGLSKKKLDFKRKIKLTPIINGIVTRKYLVKLSAVFLILLSLYCDYLYVS